MNPDRCEWLDGPGFAAWLEPILRDRPVSQGLKRRLCDWRNGSMASVYSADRWLTQFGYHLSEVPSELYRAVNPRSRRPAR